MARLADLGHEVVALYVTRGEGGIRGKSRIEAGTIRTEETEAFAGAHFERRSWAIVVLGTGAATVGICVDLITRAWKINTIITRPTKLPPGAASSGATLAKYRS